MTAIRKTSVNDSCIKYISGWQMHDKYQWMTGAWNILMDESCMKNIRGWYLHKIYQRMTASRKPSVDFSCVKDIRGWQLHEIYRWMKAAWKISVDDSHTEISLAPSTSQTKHAVQQGKVCWHGVLDCGLGPRLVTGTVKKSKLLGATVLKHRAEQQQTKSFGRDEHQM